MKRKVILMGGKTYVLSLPSTWIKKYSINKSEELDVEERDNKVVISTGKGKALEKVKIDVSDTSYSFTWWSVSSAYIKGADEIEILFSTKTEKDLVNEVARSLIGFAIIKESSNSYLLKDVSGNFTDFEPIFRRVFLMLKSFGEEGLDYIRENNFDKLVDFRLKDHEINYSVNYCLRYLNKMGYSNYDETSFIYSTLRELESLGDEFADLFRFIAENKVKMKKEYIQIIDEVNKLFDLYYQLFYKYEKGKVLDIIKFKRSMFKERNNLFEKASKNEAVVISHLRSITTLIFNLTELKMVSTA